VDSSPTSETKREKLPDDDGSTADRLLQTAASLFRRKGYGASTTRELADLLGIQKASLYHHIRGKEDLLLAVSLESLKRIIAAVAVAESMADPGRRLEPMIAAHVEVALRDRDMHMTMLTELRSLSQERRSEVLRLRDHYEGMIRKAIAEEQQGGQLRGDIEAKYLSLALLNLLNWTIFWFDPQGSLSATELASMLSTIFLDGAQQPCECAEAGRQRDSR
jgi:TetR/AcrR family transcriptional regulator, cholesterol catabolism regulator